MGDNSIYIVVAVLAVVLIGVAIFLFSIDRKVRRLEKKNKDQP